MTRKRDNGGIIISLILACIGIAGYVEASKLSEFAGIFPKTFSIILAICSIAYVIVGMLRGGAIKKVSAIDFPVRGILLYLVLLVWAFSFNTTGFVITAAIGYFALAMITTQGRKITPVYMLIHAALACLIVGGFYILFKVLLGVPLPAGILI